MRDPEINKDSEDEPIRRLVTASPIPPMRSDFADSVMAKIAAQHEKARFEKWVMLISVILTSLLVLASAVMAAGLVFTAYAPLKNAPWPLLLTTFACLALVWLFDSVVGKSKPEGLSPYT